MGGEPTNWKESGGFPPQGVPSSDGEATLKNNRWELGIPPLGAGDEVIRIEGGGGLYLSETKHGGPVYCDTTDPGPVHRGGVEAGCAGV